MRPVIRATGTLFWLFPLLWGADLTVVLDFEAARPARPVAEMKAETERLLTASGVSVDWRWFNDFQAGESYPKLAVVKFKGQCGLTPFAPPAPEDGAPLGLTHTIEGRIIPFSEVECEQVRGALGKAHLSGTPEEREVMYGRALGRVLAHELLHVVSGSKAHSRHGVTQRYLSAAKLAGDHM